MSKAFTRENMAKQAAAAKAQAKYSTKRQVREALDRIEQAGKALDVIRDHYNFEWGENGHCDLDLAISHALARLQEAQKELDDLLTRFRGKGIPLDWPKGRSWV